MRYRIGSLLLLVCVVSAEAKDRPGDFTAKGTVRANGGSGAFHERPPKEDDTVFAVDTGRGLDTGCTFRRGGPLIIELPVRRYVGKVHGNGLLQDPDGLTSGGLLSKTALLSLPVFDVDQDGDPTDPSIPPEVDRIFFNGTELERPLTGANDEWKMNTFRVEIELIRFPDKGAPPAVNEIRIEIDDLNRDDNQWCTAVDWVALEFQAVAPVFLVHGFNAKGQDWGQEGFTAGLETAGIPYSDAINLSPFASMAANGHSLAAELEKLAERFGARKCHIVAHSKGGLDTRAFLNDHYNEKKLQVLSVYTLSTPHRGTPLADAAIGLAVGGAIAVKDPRLLKLLKNLFPAVPDLTTVHMLAYNLITPSPGVPFISYGAQADTPPFERIIAGNEARHYPAVMATIFYNIVGHGDRAVVLVSVPVEWGDWDFGSISIPAVTEFVPNDIVVSQASARFGTYVGTLANRNHTTMKSAGLARQIVDDIVSKSGVK